MRKYLVSQYFWSFIIVFSVFIIHSQTVSAGLYSYYCDKDNNIPTTFVRTHRGALPMIRWVSTNLPSATPEQRCQKVSRNFQTAYEKGSLKFITTGLMNNQPVVCTATRKEGDCKDLLFTLKAGSNPKKILRQLLDRRGLSAGNPLDQAGVEFYLDFEDYLTRLGNRFTVTKN